jgi:hypothetical protein
MFNNQLSGRNKISSQEEALACNTGHSMASTANAKLLIH